MKTSSASWWPLLAHTPLRDLCRRRLTASLDWRQKLRDAQLPPACELLVASVIRKTRLWRREKGDLALELAAHFHDGIDTGKNPAELVAAFGNPTQAARLIRRAQKRKRPWPWQARHRFFQALGVAGACYAALILLALSRHPSPTVDYLTQLNGAAAAAAEADRAWPLYRAILTDYAARGLDSKSINARPSESGWRDTQALLRDQADFIQTIRDAAAKPALGLLLGFGRELSSEDALVLFGPEWDPPAAPGTDRVARLSADFLAGVFLPHLAKLKALSLWIIADMAAAAEVNDGARFLADQQALLGIARHLREHPLLINQLVALAMLTAGEREIATALLRHPEFLTSNQLTELAHVLARLPDLLSIDLEAEQIFFRDLIQRIYSDDGSGDGLITQDGLRFLAQVGYLTDGGDELFPGSSAVLDHRSAAARVTVALATPLMAHSIASRSEVLREYERLMNLTRDEAERPLWIQITEPSQMEAEFSSLRSSPLRDWRYLPVTKFTPVLTRVGMKSAAAIAFNEALLTAIALDLYRRETGAYPESLAALCPRWLPEIPVDASTGKPLLFRVVEGRPVLYGRGRDGVDNAAAQTPAAAKTWPQVPEPSGEPTDWVLFPPPARS